MKNSIPSLSVHQYQSAPLFLQDYYRLRKQSDDEFSYEVWANELGAKNRSYLRLVVMGQRPISEELIESFGNLFQFSAEEAAYFSALVHYSQAKSKEQREVFGRKLLSLSKICDDDRQEVGRHYEFLSDSMLPQLQTVLGFDDAPQSESKLAELFQVDAQEISTKISKLEDLGLVREFQPQKKSWKIAPAHQALGHREFYRTTLKRAEESIELPFDLRKFRSLFMAMNAEEFADFQKDFEIFAKEQLAKRDVNQLKGRRLYQMNFNFFPTTAEYGAEEV